MTARLTSEERREIGREARRALPRTAHGSWEPAADRPDPVSLLEEQDRGRLGFLVPVRHQRMRESEFTFFRGAANIMASDLAHSPDTGFEVQLGGDAHLSNFGAYASPERALVFDQNDFDETLPGPWEWDLKRLAASVMIASQHLGLPAKQARRATSEVTRSYREAMAKYAEMGHLELWYDHVRVDDLRDHDQGAGPGFDKRLDRFEKRATKKTSLHALSKLAEKVDGTWHIRTEAPVLFSLRNGPEGYDPDEAERAALAAFEAFKPSLDDSRQALLERYEVVDIGVKVVGVGSVGTRCLVILLQGRDENDPLFLQAKEAGASVLEPYLAPSRYDNHGRRVVEGQRLVQAQSDIFLGWTVGSGSEVTRDFYVRQLRDWKGSADITEGTTANQLAFYGSLCGLTLARGHARSGDPIAIRSYAGRNDTLDRAVTAFAEAYAVQNRRDYQLFQQAIEQGRLEVATEESS
ncbi:MAG: DUF2252 domain-containing protein [Microthrixaceae bacterium]|nr:DUF2252 domain-containing protein [Microthrixaceae bacterium]MCB9386790.1 DUF2252 domain-containing protein [Microthrixaceae bacterium]MCO5320549.1 DUF2252 domain-containing protein [Microthrixaceae bacterium]